MTKSEISKLYKTYHVPKSIISHMKQVANVCKILANKFEGKGIKINKKILINTALTHDVFRVCDIKDYNPKNLDPKATKKDIEIWQELRDSYKKIGHEMAISRLLRNMGEYDLAGIIMKHDFYRIDQLKTWEEKLLYYADKRVDFDTIVDLKIRFEEGRKRNSDANSNFEKIVDTEQKVILLEKEIISKIGDFDLLKEIKTNY